MKRLFALLLCIPLLALPAQAADPPRYVALTFDDGPTGRITSQLLDGLYDRGVQATFLLCGYRMAEFPDITQRIFEDGHEIGYHGYSHKTMKIMSRRSIADEIMESENLLPEGCEPVFLRPPGGGVNDAVEQVARARGLALLSWSVDPRDWATDDTAAIETAVLDKIKDGDIVLLHDMMESSVRAALDIVDALLAEDFEFVTVSELARLKKVTIRPGEVYTNF